MTPCALRLAAIARRIEGCWAMVVIFTENRDAHGVHDMGVEIQALERAKAELEALDA